jgi:molybdopterin-guanine dinucleotide biosynthesis protein A
MGFPKHEIQIGRTNIVEHLIERLRPQFDEVLLVGTHLPSACRVGVRVIRDLLPVRSPLVGIYSGLAAAANDLCFVVACDMPCVLPALVEMILSSAQEADVAVPVVDGYYEPLCAAYRRTAIPVIERALHSACYRITAVYEHLRIREVPRSDIQTIDPDLQSFVNINTRQDLAVFLGR